MPLIDGRSGFTCAKCGLKYKDPLDPLPEETKWVFCPVCEVAIHTTCIGFRVYLQVQTPQETHKVINVTFYVIFLPQKWVPERHFGRF